MEQPKKAPSSLITVLKGYKGIVLGLVLLTTAANALNLAIPKLVSGGIDAYSKGTFDVDKAILQFTLVAAFIFVFSYLQALAQTFASEKIGRDLRTSLTSRISEMTYARLEKETTAKLLTNLTSDIDAVKQFVANAVSSIISSACLIVGSAILLLLTNWKLALPVLLIIPLIGVVFALVFKKIGPLFYVAQQIIDKLNQNINESILGAALVRVFNSPKSEEDKFAALNGQARDNGLKLLRYFSLLIPVVGIIANMATLVILTLGGYFAIQGSMTIGDFAAFNSYVFILIFPIIILGFMSNVVSRANISYGRIASIVDSPEAPERGDVEGAIKGDIEVKGLTVSYGEKAAIKDVSLSIKAKTRTAIIGPTAAGKTQLLYALIGLIEVEKGGVLYDGKPIESYKRQTLHDQVGLVFQDSSLFNMSLRENIAFNPHAKDEDVRKAIDTAELGDFVHALPQGLDTVVSERGTSLSGGQKQRIMLARALALNPKVLLLDDFTARVDAATEKKILANVRKNYPHITIVSVTQKVASVEDYDQIVLLMEGEVLAAGTHRELLESSPEYVQIAESQRSTNAYELRS